MKLNLNLISKQQNGKKKNRLVTFINPNASNEDLATFAVAFMNLSENHLLMHLRVTCEETLIGFLLGVIIGVVISIILRINYWTKSKTQYIENPEKILDIKKK